MFSAGRSYAPPTPTSRWEPRHSVTCSIEDCCTAERTQVMRLQIGLTATLLTLSITPLTAQWTQGTGKIWVKSALFVQKTSERFDVRGNTQQWFANGESDARAVFTDVIVGLRPNLDLWVQVPYFDLRFTDDVQELTKTGLGDLRAWLRWQPFTLHNGQTPVTFRFGAKAPLGESEIDAQVIPLGEGQWDLESFVEVGHSFWPAPAYAQIWLGYRARFANQEKLTDPGGEYVYLAEAGIQPVSSLLLKATLDGFFGRAVIQDRVVTGTKRQIMILQFGTAVRVGPIWPEAAIRLPLRGREFPKGPQFTFGLSAQIR